MFHERFASNETSVGDSSSTRPHPAGKCGSLCQHLFWCCWSSSKAVVRWEKRSRLKNIHFQEVARLQRATRLRPETRRRWPSQHRLQHLKKTTTTQFLSDPNPIIALPCLVSHSIHQSLLLLRLDWCGPGVGRSTKIFNVNFLRGVPTESWRTQDSEDVWQVIPKMYD